MGSYGLTRQAPHSAGRPCFLRNFDIAEIEFLGVWHGSNGPSLAGVNGSCVGAIRAADLRGFRVHDTQTAKTRLGLDRLLLPLGFSKGIAEHEKQRGEGRPAIHNWPLGKSDGL